MRCAENLVDACLRGDASVLFAFTGQIFGLCDAHGASDPETLFEEYRHLVHRMTTRGGSRADAVRTMDALVWDPGQRNLSALLNVRRHEWSSVLTAKTPALFNF